MCEILTTLSRSKKGREYICAWRYHAVWLFESDTFMGCNKDLIVFCDIDKILLVTKKQLMLGFATISGIAFLETHAHNVEEVVVAGRYWRILLQ